MSMIYDLEYDLMSYCIKHEGEWWASHFFRNREVDRLYDKLRNLDVGTVTAIIGNGGSNYQKHIDLYAGIVRPQI